MYIDQLYIHLLKLEWRVILPSIWVLPDRLPLEKAAPAPAAGAAGCSAPGPPGDACRRSSATDDSSRRPSTTDDRRWSPPATDDRHYCTPATGALEDASRISPSLSRITSLVWRKYAIFPSLLALWSRGSCCLLLSCDARHKSSFIYIFVPLSLVALRSSLSFYRRNRATTGPDRCSDRCPTRCARSSDRFCSCIFSSNSFSTCSAVSSHVSPPGLSSIPVMCTLLRLLQSSK